MKATTVEQTGKKWKALQLLGVVLILIGLPLSCQTTAGQTNWTAGIPLGLGMLSLLVASVAAWWYHG